MLERNVVMIGYFNMGKRCKKELSIENVTVLIVKKVPEFSSDKRKWKGHWLKSVFRT